MIQIFQTNGYLSCLKNIGQLSNLAFTIQHFANSAAQLYKTIKYFLKNLITDKYEYSTYDLDTFDLKFIMFGGLNQTSCSYFW